MPLSLTPVQVMAAKQDGLVYSSQLPDMGIAVDGVRRFCRSGAWRRLQKGVFLVDAPLYGDVLPPRTVIRAAVIAAGPAAVVASVSAGVLHGLDGLPAWDGSVHLADAISTAGPRGQVVMHQWRVRPQDVVLIDGIRVTSPERTVADLVLSLDRLHGLSVLDSALHLRLFDPSRLVVVRAHCFGRPGVRQAEPLFELADGRAESPLESRVRLRCIDGDVAPDDLQWPVQDQTGWPIAYADMVWKRRDGRMLVGEADGAEVHSQPEALFSDRRRANRIVACGHDIVRFTWADTMRADPVPRMVRAALAAA